MKASLSSTEVAGLAAAIEALLSPHDFPSSLAWREAVSRKTQSLIGNDCTLFQLPGDPEPLYALDAPHDLRSRGMQFYHEDPSNEIIAALGCRVATQFDIVSSVPDGLSVYHSTPIYQGYHRPLGLFDVIVVTAANSGGMGQAPSILAYASQPDAGCVNHPRARQFMQLLWAPLTAAWATWRTTAGVDLANTIDSLAAGLGVFRWHPVTNTVTSLHQNPYLARWMAADSTGRLAAAVTSVAAAVLRATASTPRRTRLDEPTTQAVDTIAARFEVHGITGRTPFGITGTALVCVKRIDRPAPIRPAELAIRFGLSPAEARVGAMLAEGRRNADIAATLGISPHTARHHTERVLRKLSLDSRLKIAAILGR